MAARSGLIAANASVSNVDPATELECLHPLPQLPDQIPTIPYRHPTDPQP